MEGWKTEKFKKLIDYKSGYTWSKEQELAVEEPNSIRVLTVSNVQDKLDLTSELYLAGVSELDKIKKQVSKDWSIAVSSNGNRNRIGNAIFIDSDTNYLFASFLTAFKPFDEADILPYYFYLWLSSSFVQRKITSVAEGTTGLGNLSIRFLRNMDITFPTDKAEQTAIAKILSTVDEAIRSTRETISKLERVKKSLMQNLLSGKMKPDGTLRPATEFYEDEKMGLVPKGWTVKAIGDKSICKINPNYSYVKNKEYDFIPMEAIKDKFRGVDYMEKQKIGTGSFTRFKKGDILFAKITPCSENGKVALVEEMTTDVGFASTEFIVFQPQNNIDNKYCYYLLSSGAIHRLAISLMEGTTGRQRIPWKIFRNRIFVPIPEDIEEQKMMVRNISSIEDLCKTKQEKITALELLKKSLMQQLLTGRVRVK